MDGVGTSAEVAPNVQQAVNLGRVSETQVINPVQAAIPRSEGIHLEVRNSIGEKPWAESDPKILFKDCFVALAAAKAITEGRFTPEQWVNIHLSGRPEFDKGVNVFGRNPDSETGWGKPVHFNPGETQLSQAEVEDLTHLFKHYLPLWEKTLPQVNLFADGIKAVPVDSEEFTVETQAQVSRNETVLWMNDKFVLVLVNSPHLNGLHLVTHARDSYWRQFGGFKRPWQNQLQEAQGQAGKGGVAKSVVLSQIMGFLEAEAILIGAQRVLLREGKLPFYNPEVHFSSNWASSLKPVEEGGKLDKSYLSKANLEQARKDEKKSHRVGGDKEWELGIHGHLYATRDSGQYVELPSRPESEVPEQWEGISRLSSDEIGKVKELTQQNLTSWLETNATGSILVTQIS